MTIRFPPKSIFTTLPLPSRGGREAALSGMTVRPRGLTFDQAFCSLPAMHAGTSKSSSLPAYGRTTLSQVSSQIRDAW